jgi:hypothetical protein
MYAVSKRERVIGAGWRPIKTVFFKDQLVNDLESIYRNGKISEGQYRFLKKRQVRIVKATSVFNPDADSRITAYEIWADLTQRDETAYTLLSV